MLCEVTIAVRTKALKCLASVIEVDPSVLTWVSCVVFVCALNSLQQVTKFLHYLVCHVFHGWTDGDLIF